MKRRLLLERALLRQWGNTGSAPEGSSHYSGSDEIQIALLLEQSLLRRGEIQKGSFGSRHCCGNGGNTEKAPAGAGTAAAVGKTVGLGWGGEEKAPVGASTAAAVREYR